MIHEEGTDKVALCLSGGGFRAALFHTGALQRLNELGVLSRVSTVCSVSGGSIANGVLATRWRRLQEVRAGRALDAFKELVADPIYRFCRDDLRTEVLLWDRINPVNWPELLQRDKSVTDRLARAYADRLMLDDRLASLPEAPEFVFLAANMTNGGPWEFRQSRIGDWYTGFTVPGDYTVAAAVAASSSYPVAFPPLRLVFDPAAEFRGGHGRPDETQAVRSITLTDGGVYDNLGLEPVREGFGLLLVSDAGHPLTQEELPDLGPYARVVRSLDIIANQVGAQRRRWLIEAFKSNDIALDGAYWGLASKVSNYGLASAPSYPNDLLPLFEGIRTDLDPFSEGEIGSLVNHGYALANVAAQKWASVLLPETLPAFVWPFPNWTDSAKVAEALAGSSARGIMQDLWKSVKRRAADWL